MSSERLGAMRVSICEPLQYLGDVIWTSWCDESLDLWAITVSGWCHLNVLVRWESRFVSHYSIWVMSSERLGALKLRIAGACVWPMDSLHEWAGGGWGCEVSCGGHHRQRGKTTTGSALDGAVFDIAQGMGGAVRFLVVGTIGKEERPPPGQPWMEQCLTSLRGWVGLWGFLWWAPSAKRKDHHGVSPGWSSVWHRSGDGWGCEVSCGGHHRQRRKTTTGSALDGAVFDIAQGMGGAVRFLVVGIIGKEERPPPGQPWMEQCLTSLKYWPI